MERNPSHSRLLNARFSNIENEVSDSNQIQSHILRDVPALPLMLNHKKFDSSKTKTWSESKEQSCLTLLAIVLLFLVTHSFRLSLKMFEFLMPHGNTREHYEECFSIGRYGYDESFLGC